MNMKRLLALSLTLALTVTTFYGCGKSQEASNNSQSSMQEVMAKFPIKNTNDAPSIKGGVLKVALVIPSAFEGILNPCFSEITSDSEIFQWFLENILSSDESFVFDQDGAATYTYDQTAKTMTLKLKDGIKWHDGQPVTLDDLVYAYEVICDKDYEGMRYDEQFTNIVGVEEFHAGKAKTISGLELSSDKMTLTIKFKKFFPSILVGGIWVAPIPRHYYGEIPVKDMKAHEKSRKTPIGFGPFKVKSIVPGEAVELVRNDDYYLGAPKLDGVTITVIAPDLVPAAMEEGKFDIALFSAQQYPDYKEPKNYSYVGQLETIFDYTGFKLGKWEESAKKNHFDPNAKMANVKLRQAIGYAVDIDKLAKEMYNGLRFLATTVITPRHATYQNTEIAGYTYDPEKAKKLLDEAGYKDVDKDGYREDPKGKPFTITWAVRDGQNIDTYAQFKMQNWKDAGLNVELYNGRPTEVNAFYDAVEHDDPKIDMYDAGWQTGFDPNPKNLWGADSSANYTRYTSETFNSIMEDISSEKAWDKAFLSEKYHAFQQAFFDEAPAIPTLWRMKLDAVNNRVKNYELTSFDCKLFAHLIEVTSDAPVKKADVK